MVGAVTWKIRFKKERGGVGPSKNWVGQKFLLQSGNKTGMGGLLPFLLLYSSVQSHLLCVWGKVRYHFITFWIFSLLS